ncbi:MAG: Hsp70 heat shock protein [Labilithrix sp.]|nr:Hsp70 heat shock protein [Labilithrix sp.]
MKLGIDFGTTRTVVACVDRGNYPVLTFTDASGDAQDWFPSVVAERRGELRFGFEALATAGDPSFTAVRSFKRLLADASAGPSTEITVGDTTLTIDALITQFLAALKVAILERSNLELDGDEAELRSVVAVPANSSGAQRFVTLDAFRRAGFAPIAMLNEPSAAGFEYTHRHRDTLTSKRDHVVVYDLGGGTFDASLVRMRGRKHEVMGTAGVNQLGGDDFDEVLLELVLGKLGIARTTLEARGLERLLDQCRDAKERLNPSSKKISIDVESALGDASPAGAPAMAVINVADFYAACMPLVNRSIDAMVPVMAKLEGAAEGEVPGLDEIAGIYVVGGASELPIVARALRERFGRRVHRSPYPSAAIAIGLAIACDEAAGFELTDRYARTFGVFREAQAGAGITFDPIFTSDTALPARDGDPVSCRRDYRAAHNVGHFRFFECSAISEDGRPRGDMMVSGDILFPFDPALAAGGDLADVLVERTARGPRIEEEYSLDDSGIVAIRIKNVDAGFERVYRLGTMGGAST